MSIPPPMPTAAKPPFSATDAAFAGFRLARREPLTILVWAALFLALFVVMGGLMVATIGPQMMELQAVAAAGQAHPDTNRTLALMGAMAPAYSIIMLVSLLFYGLMFAAVNRAILRPAGTPGRLAFGVDELLQLAVLIVVWVALFAVYLVAILGVVLATVLLSLASKAAGGIVAVLGIFAVLAALTFVMVRLSLASPLALDQKKLDFAASWRLTRGRFWPLLGAYLLAFLVMAVTMLGAMVVFSALAAMLGGGMQAAGVIFRPDMTSLASYFSGVMLAWMVAGSALYGLMFAVLLGAPADAYLQLSRGRDGQAALPAGPAAASDRSTAFGARI